MVYRSLYMRLLLSAFAFAVIGCASHVEMRGRSSSGVVQIAAKQEERGALADGSMASKKVAPLEQQLFEPVDVDQIGADEDEVGWSVGESPRHTVNISSSTRIAQLNYSSIGQLAKINRRIR